MATNYVQKGEKLDYSNSGSEIKSGGVVVVGSRIAVAEGDIAATTGTGVLCLEGVFALAKKSGETFAVGDKLFWSVSDAALTKTATANVAAGICFAAAGSSDTTANVKLGDLSDFSPAAVVAAIEPTTNIPDVATGGTPDCSAAAINTALDTVETRLDTVEGKINAILTALKNAGLMASS